MSDCPFCPAQNECYYPYKPCDCVGGRKFRSLEDQDELDKDKLRRPEMGRDEGPWKVYIDEKGKTGISSDDFTHDVILWPDGDFFDEEQRKKYCEEIAHKLNMSIPQSSGVWARKEYKSILTGETGFIERELSGEECIEAFKTIIIRFSSLADYTDFLNLPSGEEVFLKG